MKRKGISLMLALTLCMALVSCAGGQVESNDTSSEPEPASESESQPERNSAGPVPQILYPDTFHPDVMSTVAYKSALNQGMMIAGTEEPVTDAALVEWFLEKLDEGSDAVMEVCRLLADDADGWYYATRFVIRDGELFVQEGSGSLNEEVVFDDEEYEATGAQLNDYGYLVCDLAEHIDPLTFKAIHDRELYENSDEAKEIYEEFLRPIYYTALGGSEWASTGELDRWIWLFEDIYNYEGGDPFGEFGNDWPVDLMATTLSRYFEGVTPEMIARGAGDSYDASAGTIYYEGGRGGGPKPLRVLDWEDEEDTLIIRYVAYSYTTGVPQDEYLLTVRLMPGGGFRYVSNLVPGTAAKAPAESETTTGNGMSLYVPHPQGIEAIYVGSGYGGETIYLLDEAQRFELWMLLRMDEWVTAEDLPAMGFAATFYLVEGEEIWFFNNFGEQVLIVPCFGPPGEGEKPCYFAPIGVLDDVLHYTKTLTPEPELNQY